MNRIVIILDRNSVSVIDLSFYCHSSVISDDFEPYWSTSDSYPSFRRIKRSWSS